MSEKSLEARHEIFVFGDSVMKGVVLNHPDERYRLLPAATRKKLEDEFSIKLMNRSHFGSTIEEGAALVKRVVERTPSCKTVVLEFGGNDCDFDWAAVAKDPRIEHQPRTTIEEFTLKYKELIAYLKDKKITTVLMNLPPVDPERYLDFISRHNISKQAILDYIGDLNMIYRFQELYSHTIDKLAYKTGSFLIDVREQYLKRRDYRDLICIDGIHPNQAGHELLYDAIRQFISKQLGDREFFGAYA